MAHLLSGRGVGSWGAIAKLCNYTDAYSISGGIALLPGLAENLEHDIAKAGHEIGHNFGGLHTHCFELEGEGEARHLFAVAGHCAPNQPIPCHLLAEATGLDEEMCAEALARLTALSLLEMDDPAAGPTLHPLLAEYARTLPGAGEEILSRLAGALAPLASEANQTGLPARFAPLRPHVEALAPAAEGAGLDEAAWLWNELGWHLNDVADYAGA